MEDREHLGVILLPAHKQALKRLAEANGEAMAVVVRGLIRREAERRHMWPTPEEKELQRQEEAHDDVG